jgi:predicted nuclease of predicted toxin-antitoxin system
VAALHAVNRKLITCKLPLDECVNPRLRQAFPDHEVLTVGEANWRALPDSKLLAEAQRRCDVLVTTDKGFEHEHNLKKLALGIVIVHVERNRMEHYPPLLADLAQAVEHIKPGEVVHVGVSKA